MSAADTTADHILAAARIIAERMTKRGLTAADVLRQVADGEDEQAHEARGLLERGLDSLARERFAEAVWWRHRPDEGRGTLADWLRATPGSEGPPWARVRFVAGSLSGDRAFATSSYASIVVERMLWARQMTLGDNPTNPPTIESYGAQVEKSIRRWRREQGAHEATLDVAASVATLDGSEFAVIGAGGTMLSATLVRAWALGPALCFGDRTIEARTHDGLDPVVFSGRRWTSLVMPIRVCDDDDTRSQAVRLEGV